MKAIACQGAFCLSMLIASFAMPTLANDSVPIIDQYPQCAYEVLDTVEVKTKVKTHATALSPYLYNKAFKRITTSLSSMAKERGADAIALISKSYPSNSRQHFFAFEAELIKGCEHDPSVALKLAKFNSKGMMQRKVLSGSIKMETRLVIDMPSHEKREQPEISSTAVSLEKGVYGINLNTPMADVIEVFGTPSVTLALSEQSSALMYGRTHFFEFTNKRLSGVNSLSDHFGGDLKNLLEFDERFDDLDWTANGEFSKQGMLSKVQAAGVSNNELLLQNADTTLSIGVSPVGVDGDYIAEGFALAQKQNSFFENIEAPNASDILSFIDTQLSNSDPNFAFDDIPFSPTLTAWLERGKRLYTYGQHVAIETNGNRISTIYLFENLYTPSSPLYLPQTWQLGKYRHGMTAQAAQKIAPTDAFYFNDTLEIANGNNTTTLFFYEQKGEVTLYAAEIKFY